MKVNIKSFDSKKLAKELINLIDKSTEVYNEDLRDSNWSKWYSYVKSLESSAVKIFEKIPGVKSYYDNNRGWILRMGEYDSYDLGAETRALLDYDTGIQIVVDHSWTQSAYRDRKGGLVLYFKEYSTFGNGQNLSAMNLDQMTKLIDKLFELSNLKVKDLRNYRGLFQRDRYMDAYKEIMNK